MQNLWAEFDNKPSDVDGRDKGGAQFIAPSKQRRPSEQMLLSSLRRWLLQDYVAHYCRSLAATRIYRRCYWVDALGSHLHTKNEAQLVTPQFLAQELARESKPIALHSMLLAAGSRRHKNGGAALSAQQLIAPSAQFSTSLTNNETHDKNGETALSAQQLIAPSAQLTTSLTNGGIIHANWLEVAPALLNVIDQSPAIFLLNPFGPIICTYDDLAPLYQRTAPTELCLFISHKQLETHLLPSLQTSVGASALTALVRSDRWNALLTQHPGQPAQVIDGIIDLLRASMERHFLAVQCIALPIQVGPATIESAPFTLVFATRRQDSLAHMNDALCSYRRRLYEESSRGSLVEEWFLTQQRERQALALEQLSQRLLQQGRSQRVRRWPDLRQQLLLANFGQFTLRDYDETLGKCLLTGQVRCEWRRQPGVGGEEDRVPGNADTLIWT